MIGTKITPVRRVALCTLFCLTFAALGTGQQRKIAFERASNVWVANLDGTDAKKITGEAWPKISPDGTRLAFNTEKEWRPNSKFERHIAVAEIASGKVTIFKDIPSDNCFGPVWSPDWLKIAFSIMADRQWTLGVVSADGSGFRLARNAEARDDTYAPAWSADGKSIFCHDLKVLYQIDLEEMFSKNGSCPNFTSGAA